MMRDDASDVEFSGIDPAPASTVDDGGRRLVTIESVTAGDGEGSVEGDVAEQARRAFANVDRRLRAEGATRDDLTKVTYYVSDRGGLASVATIRDDYVGDRAIEVAYAAVSSLSRRGALIEIDAFAVVESARERSEGGSR